MVFARSGLKLALLALVAGCSTGGSAAEDVVPPPTTRPDSPAAHLATSGNPAPLVRLAEEKLAHCQQSPRLTPVCPVLVPRVRASYLSHLSEGDSDALFNLERGVPGHAPPRGAHVTIGGGDTERSEPFEHPTRSDASSNPSDSLLDQKRQKPVSFGPVTWGGRDGVLFLAPPFLHGGQLGDHLVFEWGEGGDRFTYSLHAWEPLADTAATLKAMVEAGR